MINKSARQVAIKSGKYDHERDYWLEKLENVEFHTFPVEPLEKTEGGVIPFRIPVEIGEKLLKMSKGSDYGLLTFLLSAMYFLLYKYTGQEDQVILTPVFRQQEGRDYLNKLLALRTTIWSDQSMRDLIYGVKETLSEGNKNLNYPFAELLKLLKISGGELPANSLVVMMDTIQDEAMLEGENVNLIWKFSRLKGQIIGQIQYTELYDRQGLEKINDQLIRLLKVITTEPNIILSKIELVTPTEKSRLLYEYNTTALEIPRELTICQLFSQQIERDAKHVAVQFQGDRLSYGELGERAKKLAYTLRQEGVGPDQVVGIVARPSLDLLVGIMGILMAGGAYLPIDPALPPERMRYMLKDSGVDLILTQKEVNFAADFADAKVFFLEDSSLYQTGMVHEVISKPHHLAYIIYTSGSTGRPKGVMVEHGALVNFVHAFQHNFQNQISTRDRFLSLTNISFDVSVAEIFTPLTFGATLILFDNSEGLDLVSLAKTIMDEKVTFAYIPPTLLQDLWPLLETARNKEGQIWLDKMLVGVEPIKDTVLHQYLDLHPDMLILNGYGPTEATICATMYTFANQRPVGRNVPIGKPIANTQIFILDKDDQLCPVGVAGELCISGAGLARGYIGRPELTNEKFTPNPYLKGEGMYRTGDLARWSEDGNIEFLGRVDQQLKVRGYRIEPGEIETRLLEHPAIGSAVVMGVEDDNGVKVLCGYLVADQKGGKVAEISKQEVREFLTDRLPEYMIPTYLVVLDGLPMTRNGKIDRKALPKPGLGRELAREYVAPENEREDKLVRIWSEVLGMDEVGVTENFFSLGGHSLKATTISARVYQEMHQELPVGAIFKSPTIREQARYLESEQKIAYASIEPAEDMLYYPVAAAQKRLMILNRLIGDDISYNMPLVMMVEGKMDRDRFETAFRNLIQHHEVFRTSFKFVDGSPVQRVYPQVDFAVQYLSGEEEEIPQIIQEFIQPFNIEEPPLLRVGLMELAPNRHLFICDLHHIIADRESLMLLIRQFNQLYVGNELAPMEIQYKDFAVWQNKLFTSEAIKKQEEYWLEIFAGEIPVLNLPTDAPRPSVMSFAGKMKKFELKADLVQRLRELAMKNQSTIYMVLLAGLNILLHKYTNQDDIIVGSLIANRQHMDMERMIGMFVNTLAMRNHPKGNLQIDEFIQNVRQHALEAYENQDYQFETMIDQLNLERDLSRNPLFDIMFNLQTAEGEGDVNSELTFTPYDFDRHATNFDLYFTAIVNDVQINCNLTYSTSLFKESTIERIIEHYLLVLDQMVANPERKIADLQILDSRQKQLLLNTFNRTPVDFPADRRIDDLFRAQAERRPDSFAVLFADQKITYRELDVQTDFLALQLSKSGVGPGHLVGIVVERSLEMMIGILAILKAGGGYLPIDPHSPEERLAYILEDSNTQLLLIQDRFKDVIDFSHQVMVIEEMLYQMPEVYEKGEHLEKIGTARDLAYVIYTSGSTGRPKGVMIEHRSVINRLHWMQKEYSLRPTETILQKTPYFFDVSIWELFWWFFAGARVAFLPPNGEKDPAMICAAIQKYQVTTIHFVPSMLSIFLEYIEGSKDLEKLASLRQVFASGEALTRQHVDNFQQTLGRKYQTQLHNLYGPTEATVDVTYFDCSNIGDRGIVPIGRPIDNTWIYILDKEDNLQPIGLPGELCIGGVGLARGYLNRPKLTAEKFVPNPFRSGEKMYRTGDLARWLEDGTIEFLGRLDFQVKIRGFRIELGEIEARLVSHPEIRDGVVLARGGSGGEKYLCGYYRTEQTDLEPSTVKDYLARKLPDYMIPTYLVPMAEMPLLPNGKINRRALPDPDTSITTGYQAPRNNVERLLVEVFEDVLGVEKVGINDSFFDLGGNSILAIRALVKIEVHGWALTAQDVFDYKTPKALARKVIGDFKVVLDEEVDVDIVDWHPETPTETVEPIKDQRELQNILITGATGYLGIHILDEMIHADAENIYCLVRGDDEKTAWNRLQERFIRYFGEDSLSRLDRVKILNGDITENYLGLGQAKYQQLVEEIEMVVHAAALVKYVGPYEEFMKINVLGTKGVCDFVREADAVLGYISTASIAGSRYEMHDLTLTENEFYIGQNFISNNYIRSKFEAENLVLGEMEAGLRAVVFRISNLTGRYRDGHFQLNISENDFYAKIKLAVEVQVIPAEYYEENNLEFTPVDYCSRAILEILKTTEAEKRVFHLLNPKFAGGINIVDTVQSRGVDIEIKPDMERYFDHLRELAKNPEMHDIVALQAHFKRYAAVIEYPVTIDATITTEYLRHLGFEWPTIDQEYILKVLQHMEEVGFIPPKLQLTCE